eukprot:TRINITY_DN9503_c0_g1_i1.p1 TRINITY_DN9503_c0_g1~~TRINITY_DN9503_c0_g1_i1.p1  ORF type:complete len:507 (+),score=93.69 TRINITY_DN9503_c0_g1_i1:100-1620(+)
MDASVKEAFCCDGRTVSLPIQVLSLAGLEDLLTMDAWHGLPQADRDRLAKLLPACEDQKQQDDAVQFALTNTSGFLEGTRASQCLTKMRSGSMHPALSEQRKRTRELAELQHTLDVQDYHNKMVYGLLEYKDSLRYSAEGSDGDWSDEDRADPEQVPRITPRHPWALPMLDALHMILQASPSKQAKFEHILEISASALTPSRGVPGIDSEPEPPLRYLLRACLLFMSMRPAAQPMVQPAPGCHAEWTWAAADSLSGHDLMRLSAQLSRKLESVSFCTQLKCNKNVGFTGGGIQGSVKVSTRVNASPAKPAINIVTNEEAIREFHKQEYQRFSNPYRPYRYIDVVSGKTTVVAPLRKTSHGSTKGRDHSVLTSERPTHVTVLALVRDAAARLPNGQGTRQDICEILRSSQYIFDGVADMQLSQVVTNALDRLLAQHMDPCIEYDDQRKKYVYKHLGRTETDFINKRGSNKSKPVGKAGNSPSANVGGPSSDMSEFDEESEDSGQEKM